MAEQSKFKVFISFVLRFGISFALLAFIFSKIDTRKTLDVLKSADLGYLFYAAMLFIVIYFILLWRWIVFIRALDLELSIWEIMRFYFASLFGNLFLPSSIGGDIIKILGLCKLTPHKPRVVASVLLDRLSGFAAIVIVGLLAFIFGYSLINDISLLISIGALAGISLCVVFVLFNHKVYKFATKIFYRFPKFEQSLVQMQTDVMLLRHKKIEGFKAIGISCLNQVALAFTFFLIAKALHQDVSFIYFLIFVPLLCVASSVPSIGGLGAREAGAAYLFGKVGMDAGVAVSISLMNFMFMVLVGLLGGLYYVITLYSRRV